MASTKAKATGKAKKGRLAKDLHALLEDLTQRVVDGDLEPYPASVAGQLVGVRLRLLEFERKVQEQDELIERLNLLEEAQKKGERSPWGA